LVAFVDAGRLARVIRATGLIDRPAPAMVELLLYRTGRGTLVV
jgi:hypothetical protein